MPTNYPSAADSFKRPDTRDSMLYLANLQEHDVIDDLADAVEAIQGELGLNPGGSGLTVVASPTSPGTTSVAEVGTDASRQSVLTITSFEINVANTTGVSFGGTLIGTFPEGRILVHGAVVSLSALDVATNDFNATPLTTVMGGDFAIGSTAAGDGTLTGTDVDIIPSTSWDPFSGTPTAVSAAAAAYFDGTSTPQPFYFNMLVDDGDVANGADDYVNFSLTLTLTWSLLGDI